MHRCCPNFQALREFSPDATTPARGGTAVCSALNHLCGADLETAPDELLHGRADSAAWLQQFTRDARHSV
jgi:hypothetical protein